MNTLLALPLGCSSYQYKRLGTPICALISVAHRLCFSVKRSGGDRGGPGLLDRTTEPGTRQAQAIYIAQTCKVAQK